MARKERTATALTPTPEAGSNLCTFGRNRRRWRNGDVFVCNLRGTRWIVGRLINLNTRIGNIEGTRLIYFYKLRIREPREITLPIVPDLLVPPVGVGTLPFNRGYFAFWCESTLLPVEVLERHVFDGGQVWFGPSRFTNEQFQPSSPPRPGELCKIDGQTGIFVIDDMLSKAVGLKLCLHPDRL